MSTHMDKVVIEMSTPANDNDAPGTVRVHGLELLQSPELRLLLALRANKRPPKRDRRWRGVGFNEKQ
jgi:hypothetical protein